VILHGKRVEDDLLRQALQEVKQEGHQVIRWGFDALFSGWGLAGDTGPHTGTICSTFSAMSVAGSNAKKCRPFLPYTGLTYAAPTDTSCVLLLLLRLPAAAPPPPLSCLCV